MDEKKPGIVQIKKRDGNLVLFDQSRITNAIYRAMEAVGMANTIRAKELSDKVVVVLEYKFGVDKVPSVEDVQDIVEKVLIKSGEAESAKAYILYRQKHKEIRDARSTIVNVTHTISEYLERTDWRVKENSNEDYSFSGLMLYTAGKVIANYALNEVYSNDVSEAHNKGYVHIHDLGHGFIGYCAGWSLKNLLLLGFGGVPNKAEAGPAKHMDVVVHQMINFIGCLQMEFAGAQAFSSVDTLLAPFVKADNMNYRQVKQNMQELVFSLNIPSRWGCFSDDTEILTENGWKLGKDLEVGETIATFNLDKEEIEYLPIEKMTKYHYNGKMYNLKNRVMDQLVTPHHRVLRKIHNFNEDISKSKYVFERADELKTKIPLIPLGGKFRGLDYHEDFVRALAWIVSEGTLCRNERIGIYQSFVKNPENCEEIRSCLNNLEIPFYEQTSKSGFTGEESCLRFRLNRPFSRKICNEFFPNYIKKIPDELRNLNTNLAKIFIDTYMKADGYYPENKIYTKSRGDADILQEIIVKAGWGSTCIKNKNGIYVVRVIKHDCSQITSVNQIDYEGIVWCPTTKNGTVIVRRKDKVFISGNCQYPFSNLTFDWVVPEDMKNEKAVVGGKEQDFTYGDCQKEMDMVNKAFLEVMREGDVKGNVFTFPIPTYNLTRDFDWNSENANLLFELTSKYGLPYFQNYIGSNLDPSSIRAMCCRLNLNMLELVNRPGSMWGPGDNTGSLGVVTLNVNRLAYESKNKGEFFEKINHYMELATNALEIKRKIANNNLKNGLMPYTKRYLGTFDNHFSTIGLCGMNEACLNLLGKDISAPAGKELAIETLEFMRDKMKVIQKETGNLYNLEATPAEGASYRLARLDKKMYPKIITAGKAEPYLTNSTHLPVDYTEDLFFALEHQNDIQPLYTGGTIFHTFLGEKIDGEACKQLVKKIVHNTKCPYFNITPTFSICHDHGYLKGAQEICPQCNKSTDVYSRVVGYIRPIRRWNNGKQEEWKDRKMFNVNEVLTKKINLLDKEKLVAYTDDN